MPRLLTIFEHRFILGMRVDVTRYEDAVQRVMDWAHLGQSRFVCASNVHMVMEAHDSSLFRRIVNSADMVTADGMPIVWTLRLMGAQSAQRVYGPDLMLQVCEEAARRKMPIGLYGGHPEYLTVLQSFLHEKFPELEIAYANAPPFTETTPAENDEVIRDINRSGARILFVGLGCPKQERWMVEHKGRIGAVMLGVGAAFDFFAGRVKQAPKWMQRLGLEWLFRLSQDPRRLWKRYGKHNPRFLWLMLMQLLGLANNAGNKLERTRNS